MSSQNILLEIARFTNINEFPEIEKFDCGNFDLNDYLKNDAISHYNQLLAVTILFYEKGTKNLIGYCSVLNDCINNRIDETNKRISRKLEKKIPYKKRKYKSFPSVKVGRLAISKDYQNQGIGGQILDWVKIHFITNNKTGCRFITVDAYINPKVLKFYSNNGFQFLSDMDKNDDRTRLMWYDLIHISRS